MDHPEALIETTIPGDWSAALGSDYRGGARFVRRFGLPTNLDPNERVFLVIGAVYESATICLNGTELGRQSRADDECRYEVTSLLQRRNEFVAVVEAADSAGGLMGEVKLEIG